MAERLDQWPRVHSCLYNWCPAKRDECRHCDAVVTILREQPDSALSPSVDFICDTSFGGP